VSLTGTASGAFATTGVGAGKNVTVSGLTLTGGDAGNYTLTPLVLTAAITRAPLTVTADNKTKTYDGTTYTGGYTASYTGFENSETADVLSGTLSFGGAAATATQAGAHTITPSGLTSGNYTLTFADGTLTIAQKALTITASNDTKVFGGTKTYGAGSTAFTSAGLVGPETIGTVTITASGGTTTGSTVGNYTLTPSAATGGTFTAANYAITYANGQLSVTAFALTGTFTASDKTYDGNTTATVTARNLTGVVGADVVTLSGGTATFDTKNVGTGKTVTLTGATLTGANASNYTLATVNTTTAAITAKALTITGLTAQDKVYTGTLPATLTGTAALAGIVGAEAVSLTGTASGAFATTGVGAGKNVTVSGLTLTGGDAGNYTLTPLVLTAAITTAPLTVTADNKTKTYDGATYTGGYTASYTGFVNSETTAVLGGTLAFGGAAATATNAGAHAITPSGLTSGNYSLTFADGTLTIARKDAAVTPTAVAKMFGARDPFLTGTMTGFMAADNITASYARAAGESVGTYPVTATLAPAPALANYAIVYGTALLTIGQASPTITWPQPAAIVYGTPLTATQLNAVGSVPGTLTYSPVVGTVLEPGTYTLSVSFMPADATNYTGPITATVSLVVELPAAPAAQDDSVRALESSGVANATPGLNPQGSVLTNDRGTVLSVRLMGGVALNSGPAAILGQYGTLTAAADGTFAYVVNNALPAVEALNVGQVLTDTFDYTVSDRFNRTAGARLSITIAGANDAPVAVPITLPPPTAGRAFGPITVAPFTDVDNALLTYTITGLPAGVVFDPVTRTFSGTPGSVGNFSLTLTASDGEFSVATTFTLQVTAPPVNTVPSGPIAFTGDPARVVGPDGSVFAVADTDSAELTVTLSAGVGLLTLPNRTGLTLVAGSGLNETILTFRGLVPNLNAALAQLVYQAPTGFFGQDTITITATDERGNTDVDRIDPPFTVALATLGGTNVSAAIASIGSADKQLISGRVTQFDASVINGVSVSGTGSAGQLVVGSPTRQDGSVQQTTVSVELAYADGSKEVVAVKVTIYNPKLQLVTRLALNPQTSLYEQRVEVTNTTPYVIDSFRVLIPTLPSGVTLYSRSTTTATGQPAVEDTRALQPGESRVFIIEYFAPNVAQFPEPAVALEINSAGALASPLGTTAAIDRTVLAPNGRRYIEFATVLNQTYWIQYRDSATASWETSTVAVAGTGTSINWLDDGWPKTNAVPTAAREYRLLVTAPGAGSLTLAAQPQPVQAVPNGSATLQVAANGPGPFTYQWYRDGDPVAGATGTAFSVAKATLADEGDYYVVVNDGKSVAQSQTARLALISSNPGRIANLAVRAQLEASGQPLITGFVIEGNGTRPVLMRSVGETLRTFGLADAVANPALELYRGSTLTGENDDWTSDITAGETLTASGLVGAFPLASAAKDAAMVRRLVAGNYTIQTQNRTSAAGAVLVELYAVPGRDTGDSRMANVSGRAKIGPGDGALIAGLTIEGNTTLRMLARVVGPGLASFGVTDALADPTLTLYAAGASVPLATNDDWASVQTTVVGESLFRRVGAFNLAPGSRDAVIVTRLTPGSYTLVAEGKGGASGQALIEIYLID
jgi:VCBS repeat-containing protein